MRPQSPIRPSTSVTLAPYALHSRRFAMRHIFWHEDISLESGRGCIGRKRAARISRRRRSQLSSTRNASAMVIAARHSARLKRASRIQTFIFDEQIGIPAAGQKWRESFSQRHRLGIRKNRSIAPHVFRAAESESRSVVPVDVVEIVADIERPAILGTNRRRGMRSNFCPHLLHSKLRIVAMETLQKPQCSTRLAVRSAVARLL